MACNNSHPAWNKFRCASVEGPPGPQGRKGADGNMVGLLKCHGGNLKVTNTVQLKSNTPLGSLLVSDNGSTVSCLVDVLKDMGIVSKEPKPWFKVADFKGGAAGDFTGWSVSLSADGKTVAVGSPRYSSKGQVQVFSYTDNGEWEPMGDNIVGVAAGDRAGYSVSLSADGSTVAVGARYHDADNKFEDNRGHVRVFSYDYDGKQWKWTQIGKKDGIEGEAAWDQAGKSVSLSADGKTVAVGSPGSDKSKGKVRVFSYTAKRRHWTQIGKKDDIVGGGAGDLAGESVSLSADGRTVAVGSPGYSDSKGQVRVFSYNDTNDEWDTMGEIEGEAADDQAGESVSLSADGSTVAVGAPGSSAYKGNVRVFSYNGIRWTQIGSEIEGEAANVEDGRSVSLSADGKTVAVGSISIPSRRGHVRVFSYEGTEWTPIGGNIDVVTLAGTGWSVSLSADGRTVAVGSPGFSNFKGQVQVFEL